MGALALGRIGDDMTAGTGTGLAIGAQEDATEAMYADAGRLAELGAVLSVAGGAVAGAVEASPEITTAYARPSNATTPEMRAFVQGQVCARCGATADTMVAGHREALVREYYRTGTINEARMRSVRAIQPECPTCSAKEGAALSRYSRAKKKELGLDKPQQD
jgi:hypothetical protein